MNDPAAVAASYTAQAMQRFTDSDDTLLVERARLLHPTCSWWWGRLINGSRVTALCYVCGAPMLTWRNAWPLSDSGRDRILRHRRGHLAIPAASILATKDTP